MYKAILFDLDDTILSFKKSEEYAIEKVFEKYHIDNTTTNKELYSSINISYWKRLEKKEITKEELLKRRFNDFFHELNIESNDEKVKEANDTYFKYLTSVAFLEENSKRLLYILKEHYCLYIISNGIKYVQEKRLNLVSDVRDCFRKIFISEDIGYPKPQKEFIDYVLKHVPYEKSELLIVGDSYTSDILLGLNNGIDVCWYNKEGKIAMMSELNM